MLLLLWLILHSFMLLIFSHMEILFSVIAAAASASGGGGGGGGSCCWQVVFGYLITR